MSGLFHHWTCFDEQMLGQLLNANSHINSSIMY